MDTNDFPRTNIENISVSRLMIGTNWFLGFSHQSKAKDELIKRCMTAERIADVLEVFLRQGVDTLYGLRNDRHLLDGIAEAERRTGRKCISLVIPTLKIGGTPEDDDASRRMIAECAGLGARICMPHQATTDALLDKRSRAIRDGAKFMAMIRDAGMVPGLSTHTPEAIVYADETGLDAQTYIQIYNAAGFLMQIEADWIHRVIWNAKKPVIVIKPLAAGRLLPLVGLSFVWSTIRDRDMVCVGTSSPEEAAEVIELSRAILERRAPRTDLQKTRSKQSL